MDMRVPPHLFVRNGVWYVKRVLRGERLRESTGVKVGGVKELRKAILLQQEIEKRWEKQADGTAPKDVPSFREWWATYQAAYTKQKAQPRNDVSLVAHALERWGRLRLNHISKSMCESYLHSRLGPVSQGTVNRERGLLQAMFQRAIEDHLVEHNPFKGIKRVPDAVRTKVLSQEDQVKLHAALSPQFQRWLVFMLGTGLRIEEACAIRIEHLDREGHLLHVPAYAAKYKKARAVPLYPAVEKVIDQQMEAMGRLWTADQQNYRAVLARGAEVAGIEHINPHALRHTFATRYLQANGNIYKLSKILGHASVTLTEKQYVHLVKSDLVEHSLGLDLGLVAPIAAPAEGNLLEA